MGVFTFNNLMAAIQSHGLTESFLLPMILNMSITGSLTILFVLLVRLAVKRAPKIFSYALWAVVLFRLLCPVSITTDFSLLGLFDTPIMENTEHTTVMEYVPFDVVHTRDLEVHLPVTPVINEAVNDVLPQEHAALGADPLEGEMAIASFVWLLGVAAMAVYSVVSYYRLRQKLLTASPLRDNIYLADEITSPFVMGLVRPKIYLPSDMEEREQAYIIRHEQHHIRRGDHIIKALAFLALSIHWFNPLVWVAFMPFYVDTMQAKAMKLMASKLAVAGIIEGTFSEEGLAAMSDVKDLTSQMAKELAQGIKDNVEDIAAAFKKMAIINPDRKKKVIEVRQEAEPVPVQEVAVSEATVFGIKTADSAERQRLYEGLLARTQEEQKKRKSKKPVVDENQLSLFGFVA